MDRVVKAQEQIVDPVEAEAEVSRSLNYEWDAEEEKKIVRFAWIVKRICIQFWIHSLGHLGSKVTPLD